MTPLRVGRIVALNMYPIYHHLEQARDPGLAFTDGLPADLNAGVLDGSLEHCSAMSSIEYARNADRLSLLPVASISAAGAVDSIQVFSRVPLNEVRSVAVTRTARRPSRCYGSSWVPTCALRCWTARPRRRSTGSTGCS